MLLRGVLELLFHDREHHVNRANVAEQYFQKVFAVFNFVEQVLFGVEPFVQHQVRLLPIDFEREVESRVAVQEVNEARLYQVVNLGEKEEVEQHLEPEQLLQHEELVHKLELLLDSVAAGLGERAEAGQVLLLDAVDPGTPQQEKQAAQKAQKNGLFEEELDCLDNARRFLGRKGRRS